MRYAGCLFGPLGQVRGSGEGGNVARSMVVFVGILGAAVILTGCPVSQPPLAAFRASPTTGDAPLTVQFTDLSLPGGEGIRAWHWDFGDGTTSAERNPVHVYGANGLYPVSLTVSGGAATDTLALNDHILVGHQFQVHLVNDSSFVLTELYVDAADAQARGPNRLVRSLQPGESVTLSRRYQKGQHIVQVVLSAEMFSLFRYVGGNMQTLAMPDDVVTVRATGSDSLDAAVGYAFGAPDGGR